VTRARTARVGLLSAAAVLATGALALGAPGDLSIVSVSSTGTQGADAAESGAVSANGRYVAFTSKSAINGVATGGKVQLWVRDRTTGTTALASSNTAGAPANADVEVENVGNVFFAISGDGRYVVFDSAATNLSPGDTDANIDVFRKDLTTGAVTLVSVNSAGEKANAGVGGDPDVSYNGNVVTFTTGTATNLFPNDVNAAGASDVVVRDIAAGSTVLAAKTTAGVQANGTTERPAISADGRVVAFEAPAGTTNLAPDDTGAVNDVFVRNLAAGTLAAASDPTRLVGSGFPDISGDGRYVVFETGEKYDPVNDTGSFNDVYRRDMGTAAFVVVSAKNGAAGVGNAAGIRPSISADGSRVSFGSAATDLTTDANATAADVFTRDIATQTTRLISVNGATQGSTDSDHSAIAANGGLVSFVFNDFGAVTKLISTDANAVPDVFVKELAPNDLTPPTVTLTGPAEGLSQIASQVPIGGSVSDASGVASLTVNGVPLPLTATGGFSTSLPLVLGPNVITITATDGAGNASVTTRTVTRTGLPSATSRPQVTALKAGFSRGKLVVRVTLTANARVSVQVLRRTVRAKPRRRVVLQGVAKPVTRSLLAGVRLIKLTPPKLKAGTYVVRVRVVSDLAGASVRTSGAFTIKPPKPHKKK
jgi:hypothetical protein